MGLLAPQLQASCGDYVQVGPNAHAKAEISVAKSHPDSMLPASAEIPVNNRPCSGPHCGRQPTQLPLPVAPVSSVTHCDQWAFPVAKLWNLAADNESLCADVQPRAAVDHLFRIERPPRFD
jgi:hypothetical protein